MSNYLSCAFRLLPGGSVTPKYSVSIEGIQDRRPIRSVALLANGIWRFRDVPCGEYMVTIMSGDGSPVYELGITVNSQMSTIVLSLPVKPKFQALLSTSI